MQFTHTARLHSKGVYPHTNTQKAIHNSSTISAMPFCLSREILLKGAPPKVDCGNEKPGVD